MNIRLTFGLLAILVGFATSLTTTVQPRQSTAASMFNTFTSMIPGMVSNVLPMVLMFGLGALLVPVLGLNSLLRENKLGRSLPAFNWHPLAESAQDIFENFLTALDEMEQYN